MLCIILLIFGYAKSIAGIEIADIRIEIGATEATLEAKEAFESTSNQIS